MRHAFGDPQVFFVLMKQGEGANVVVAPSGQDGLSAIDVRQGRKKQGGNRGFGAAIAKCLNAYRSRRGRKDFEAHFHVQAVPAFCPAYQAYLPCRARPGTQTDLLFPRQMLPLTKPTR